MKIYLNKFGTLLISRQAGREAFSAFHSQLKNLEKNESLEVDFEGVATFSPSWGDEFLSPLLKQLENRLILKNTNNLSVVATLNLLEKVNQKSFNKGTQGD